MIDKDGTGFTQKILNLLWRSLAIGAGYVLASLLGMTTVRFLGMPMFSQGIQQSFGSYLLTLGVSGVLFGLTLGPLAIRMPLRPIWRIGVLFATLFMLNVLLNDLDGFFFMTIPAEEWAASILSSAVAHIGLAVLLAWIFRPASANRELPEIIREYGKGRRWISWIGRIILAGLIYLPVCLFFGMIVAPYVLPYYQDPALGLTVPGFEVILPLETVRGLLFALTLFPLIAVLAVDGIESRLRLAFWIVLALVVLGAWQPMLSAGFWPPLLRLAHGIEMTCDGIVFGLLAVWLMAPNRKKSIWENRSIAQREGE